MAAPIKIIPIDGLNLDIDELRFPDNTAYWIKNLRWNTTKNNAIALGEGANQGVLTPLEGAYKKSSIVLPAGENTTIGTYECKETNHLYVFIYNSENNHLIYRISGTDGITQKVYQGPLNFKNNPENYIAEGRCLVRVVPYINKNNEEELRSYLIFTDNSDDIHFICVEDSIATNSFTGAYFTRNTWDCYPNTLIKLGVKTPMKCIGIAPVTPDEEDVLLQNLMANKGWQFRLKFIDRYGRESEHGVISDRYFPYVGTNCKQENNGIPKCVDLTFDIGCAFVEKIQIEFRTCAGNGLVTDSDWFIYDTIDKYDNCNDAVWYEREINTAYNYDPNNFTFTYRFCANKECQPIPIEETSRLYNPLPIAASSVFPLNQNIALANTVRNREPLSCDELDKVEYTVTPPEGGCEISLLRTVTIYVPIVNPFFNEITGLWNQDIDNPEIFWGMGIDNRTGKVRSPKEQGQYFVPGNYGFIGYFAGTKFFSMSKQVLFNHATKTDYFVGSFKLGKIITTGPGYPVTDNEVPMQKFEFKVPPGRYSFRIASPLVLASEGYQSTSTNVYGQCLMNNLGFETDGVKELIIDCCHNDVILNNPTDSTLMIFDMTFGPYTSGYLKEDIVTNIPIEYNGIADETGGASIFTPFTDHNGFFFGAGTGRYISLRMEVNSCETLFFIRTRHTDDYYELRDYFAYTAPSVYPAAGRRTIKGKIEICDSDIGVAGVLVVSILGPWTYTNTNGEFTLLLHQRPESDFIDHMFISQAGSCRITRCDDQCEFCFDIINVAYQPCTEPPAAREYTIPDIEVDIIGNTKGPKNGGRYGIGITMWDDLGRPSAIQSNESHYVDIPSLQETRMFKFSTISFNLNNIVFPDWVRYISFFVTNNLNYDDDLMWVADKVEFIDIAGNVNKAAPVKIRVYYESLGEFNKQAGFATNVNWQILTSEGNSMVGDQVEFIKNGDGTWFDKATKALITYNKEGKYFDLEYQDELKWLSEGALYRFIRPKNCLNKHIYYEVCSTIRVFNGQPEDTTGVLNVYDSYFINRQIPIPEEQTGTDGKIIRVVNAKYFSFFFESNSPSDYWGYHCANKGRINIKNPYERQIRNGMEVARSKALINKSNFNGLSYFDLADVDNDFPEQEWGSITTVLPEITSILFICSQNNFVVGFNDVGVRVGEDGFLEAASGKNSFGTPQRKIGSDYGCQQVDINTIRKYEGNVFYLDRRKGALLQHNYVEAVDISKNGFRSYLKQKISRVNLNNLNSENLYYGIFIGGIDPKNREYYLSVYTKKITEANPVYINNEIEPNALLNETISIDINTGKLRLSPSFTPQYYGELQGYQNDKVVFTFKDGDAYLHQIANNNQVYNNFYGIQCKKRLQVIANKSPEKVKIFLYNEVYCKQHLFVMPKVITGSGQESRIRAGRWDKRDNFYCAPFLCNINTFQDPNIPILATAAITDGDILYGRWAKMYYESQDTDDNKYCELEAFIIQVGTQEKSGE